MQLFTHSCYVLSPIWNHSVRLDFNTVEKLVVEIFDHDDFSLDGDDFMGKVEIALSCLVKGQEICGWYTLRDEKGRECDGCGEVELKILWSDVDKKHASNRPPSTRPPPSRPLLANVPVADNPP